MSTEKYTAYAVVAPKITSKLKDALYKTYDPDSGLFGDAVFNTEKAAEIFAKHIWEKSRLPSKVCLVVYYIER